MNSYRIINFGKVGNEEGYLVALENEKNVPFEVKRVYYIFGTKEDVVRGRHAHKNLKQVLICVGGSCKVLVENQDGKDVFELSSPTTGLYIENLVWREMFEFSKDCVLLVLASDFYNESDYIRNYDEFLGFLGLMR